MEGFWNSYMLADFRVRWTQLSASETVTPVSCTQVRVKDARNSYLWSDPGPIAASSVNLGKKQLFLCLSFLICTIKIISALPLQGCCEDSMR